MITGTAEEKCVYDVLMNRGFIEQATEPEIIRERLSQGPLTCYIGFDPTASSLHVGSLVPIMALVHMQRCGHRPIALVGGGTALIGDPSGKTEMRKILTRDQIDHNACALQEQLSRYLDFGIGKAVLLNNAEWLAQLNYIEFLRDVGRHFSVNKMLAAESYRMRLEKGLNFIEFNYMLLQAFDFYHLFKNFGCCLQMGGNDQWGNMLAGIDLIRRMLGETAYSITFPLITTSLGHKMGKTEKGTVWLDRSVTSPYEYYQFWVNTTDADLSRFLALFTFLPMEEIEQVKHLTDSQLNVAKTVLAFEATRITHGEDAALSAWQATQEAFHSKPVTAELFPSSAVPREFLIKDRSAIPWMHKNRAELEAGIPAFALFVETGLCRSRAEARRLIEQGGAYVNDEPLRVFDVPIGTDQIDDGGEVLLRKGKKTYFVVRVKNA